jgi:hypothetical protein
MHYCSLKIGGIDKYDVLYRTVSYQVFVYCDLTPYGRNISTNISEGPFLRPSGWKGHFSSLLTEATGL